MYSAVQALQLILGASVLCVREIYAWENAAFNTADYGAYKPVYATRNIQTHLKSTVTQGF